MVGFEANNERKDFTNQNFASFLTLQIFSSWVKMEKNHVWLMFCFMERGLWFQFLRWELKSRPVFGQLTRWTIWSHMHIGSVVTGHLSCGTIVHLSNGIKITGVSPLCYVILNYDLLLLFINYLWLSLRKLHLANFFLWINWVLSNF